MKESVIVYALGYYWRNNIDEIKSRYEIIAYSDQNPDMSKHIKDSKFILPEELSKYSDIKIILGCLRQEGMREFIALKYNIHAQQIFYYDEIILNTRNIVKKKKRHSDKLTVVIPTYNRKNRLKRTLDLLEMQTDNDFKIRILDNCSDYSINELLEDRDKIFCDKIEIVRNKINIGMSANIANAFVQGIDGWMWLLADDDIPSIYAIEDIYDEIEHSSGVGAIHFAYHDFSKYLVNGYKDFKNLHELFAFYEDIVAKGQDLALCNGDFIYISNKVYNMKYVAKYCQDVFLYTYSGVPCLVPILFMLNNNAGNLRISKKRLVTWDAPDGDHWDYIQTLSGMRIISDFPLILNESEKTMLYKLILYAYMDALLNDVEQISFEYDIEQIEKVYYEIYRKCLDDKEIEDYYKKIKKLKNKVADDEHN